MSSNGGRLAVDEPAPGVARLTISNPDRRGALDRPILDALARELAELDARCVIVTGEGAVFSSGYDVSALRGDRAAEEGGAAEEGRAAEEGGGAAEPGDRSPERGDGATEPGGEAAERGDRVAQRAAGLVANPFEVALEAMDAHPWPLIAALNGHTIGGGLELALACDLRIAAGTATFAMPPARLGLVYSHTGVQRFIDAIGGPRTRELFLTATRIDAPTALAWGLVNRVSEDDRLQEEAIALAAEIASMAPLAQRGNKRVIGALLSARARADEGLVAELMRLRQQSLLSADFQEGLRAFAEKRAPEWRGR